jgi:hypothetical protein
MSALSDFQESVHRSVVAEAKAQVARLKEAIPKADEAFQRLPLASTTRECPKCLFGMLTYRYRACTHLGDDWWTVREDPYLASRMLIVRNCPQCGADCFERPADSINDYESNAA